MVEKKDNNPNAQDIVYIGSHIPKTGGNTFHKHVAKYYKFNSEFIHFAPAGRKKSKARGEIFFDRKSLAQRNKCKIIFGHDVNDKVLELFQDKVPIYFTFLRQPARHYVSRWNYYKNFLQSYRGSKYYNSFEEFYQKRGYNLMSKFICEKFPSFCDPKDNLYDKTKTILDKFEFVFLTEYMNEQLISLFQNWNIPINMTTENVTKSKKISLLKLEPELEEKLNYENDVDFRIYSEYCEAWGKPVPKLGVTT